MLLAPTFLRRLYLRLRYNWLKLVSHLVSLKVRFFKFIKGLFFPLYLFPLKLVTYPLYYLFKSLLRFISFLARLILKVIIWPFRSWSRFGKTVFWGLIFLYFAFTEYRFLALVERYGGYDKFFCSQWVTSRQLKSSVVRVVGGYSEGSGTFIAPDQVLTNFHVIEGEPSPKVILPDGNFLTPTSITAYKEADLAILHLEKSFPNLVFEFAPPHTLTFGEPVLAAGYSLGTQLEGEVSISDGIYTAQRHPSTSEANTEYLQTNISLVKGMSGGPLVDQCGNMVGLNTTSLSGASFFVSSSYINRSWDNFTDQDITKINVDPSQSPKEAVEAFYTYLKTRQMQQGFDLLSSHYLEKTNYKEWTSRFTDILDVTIYLTELVSANSDTVFVKFKTKNWVGDTVEYHYYQGTWQTVLEDEVYKMYESDIEEVQDPSWEWFYEGY